MALQAGIPYTLTSASANNPTAYLSKKTDVRGDAYYYGKKTALFLNLFKLSKYYFVFQKKKFYRWRQG